MNIDPGVLVLDRASYFRALSTRGTFATRVPSCRLSHGQIAKSYRGLEGDPWPDDEMEELAPISRRVEISGGVKQRSGACDVIVLSSRPLLDPGLLLVGYDVGYWESRYSHFSSIFHEVLFGLSGPMRDLGTLLNRDLLFSTRDTASRLVILRKELLASGTDLESGGPPVDVIEIYGEERSENH